MNSFKKTSLAHLIIFAIFSTFYLSCKKEDVNPDSLKPSMLSFINACSDCPSLRVWVDDTIKGNLQVFYPNSQQYFSIQNGNRKITVKDNANTMILNEHQKTFDGNKYYTLILSGGKSALSAAYINDDYSLPDSSKAYMRIINILTDGTQLDLAQSSGGNLINAIQPNAYSNFIQLPSGFSFLQLKKAGTNIVYKDLKFTLVAGKFYTVYCYGTASTFGFNTNVK